VASAEEKAAILKMFEDGPGGTDGAFTGNGLQLGRGYGLRATPGAMAAMDDGIIEARGNRALVAMRDVDIDAQAAAERAKLQVLARQRAAQVASAPAGSASNMDARDIRATFGYESMLSRQLAEAGGAMAPRDYPEMRAPVLSARETAVDWMRSVVGTSRAGDVVTGAFDAWLGPPEALTKLPDAVGATPSAATRLAMPQPLMEGGCWMTRWERWPARWPAALMASVRGGIER
jgi:hypothetical protein